MNSLIDFASDSKVHDTVLMTMVITSFLAAIRRFKEPKSWWQLGWNFLFDWAQGFWSMKTGQPLHPATTQQLETHTDGTRKDVKLTTSIPDPTPPATPAQP
jgi:hypothetical protein